jgi:hypothetical protein
LNTRSTPRFIARSVNIWANISQAGEPAEASIKCSTASCQWLVVLGLGQLLNVAGGIFQSDQLAAVGKLYGLVESSMPPAVFVDLDFKAGARTFPWRVGWFSHTKCSPCISLDHPTRSSSHARRCACRRVRSIPSLIS